MIRLCIIGCGAVVDSYHARILPTLGSSIRVTACYDVDVAQAKATARRFAGAHGAHVDRMGEEVAEWDAALVATPPAWHAPIAGRLVDAHKHVLLEKPFVVTAAEAVELVRHADRAGVRLLVGHFRRYYPSVESARLLVSRGDFGPAIAAEVWEGGRWAWPARSSYAFTSPDGGVVLDTGSHALDTLLYVLGLDAATAELSLEDVAKTPALEPSQDVRARGRLTPASGAGLSLRVSLSRLEPLAAAVRLRDTVGRTLIVPAGYSEAATIIEDGITRRLGLEPDADFAPADAMSAFHCEYVDLLRSIESREYVSRIDASRFVTLTRMLEQLTSAR